MRDPPPRGSGPAPTRERVGARRLVADDVRRGPSSRAHHHAARPAAAADGPITTSASGSAEDLLGVGGDAGAEPRFVRRVHIAPPAVGRRDLVALRAPRRSPARAPRRSAPRARMAAFVSGLLPRRHEVVARHAAPAAGDANRPAWVPVAAWSSPAALAARARRDEVRPAREPWRSAGRGRSRVHVHAGAGSAASSGGRGGGGDAAGPESTCGPDRVSSASDDLQFSRAEVPVDSTTVGGDLQVAARPAA